MTERKTKMFGFVTETYNPIVGCSHECLYCWSRRLAKRQKHRCKLCYEFKPHLHEERLGKKWRKPKTIFTVDMGDMFCSEIPGEWILKVLDTIAMNQHCKFLLLTKNPSRYHEFTEYFPSNVILGTTIETNRGDIIEKISKAPKPMSRFLDMKEITWTPKFVAVEPILEFDLPVLIDIITEIEPKLISIGYDNYKHQLPEPPLNKTQQLIEQLQQNGFEIELKTIRKAWWED